MSSSRSTRRSTGASSSSSAGASSKPTASSPTHAIFAEAANDVVLRSSDAQSFRFRRAYLEAASDVFDDLFALASATVDGSVPRKRTGDGPIVDLADEGEVLETFLLFIHPRAANPALKTWEELERCVRRP